MADDPVTAAPAETFGDREFRELADNAPVMIWRAGLDKACDWFNRPWLAFVGRSMAQEIGYGWAEGVHPDDFDRCVATYNHAFDRREPFSMIYRLKRHDGAYRALLDNGAPFEREGVFAGYFGSCVDVTVQLELEQHQKSLLAELQHRVKNNLQLILSFIALRSARAAAAETRDALAEIGRRIRGIGAIQERLTSGNAAGRVDLGRYLPELAQDILANEGREPNGGVTLDVQAPALLASSGAATTLGLIVNELLTNSLKHGLIDGRGTIAIALRATRDTAILTVEDEGPGFPDARAAAHGRNRSAGGALIAAFGRKLRADIERANVPGARVTITIPLASLQV